ncbi:hypothetical protein [Nostoc sp. FACHB-892]
MFISSQLQTDGVHLRALYQYVERFYSTRLTTGIARDTSCGKFCPIPRTTSSLSRFGDISIETATQRH